MADERVDRGWQSRGIDTYPIEAIFGTLHHYGVDIDEAGFTKLAETEFPLGIAQRWHKTWKGKGQFAHFPAVAAEELWRRLKKGAIAPTDVVLTMANLLEELDRALAGKPDDGTRDTRFKVVENYLGSFPPPSVRREKFIAETVGAMGQWLESLDGMAQKLAKRGLNDLADRFVAIEERLFPVRAGTASALVLAAKGDVINASRALDAIGGDASKDDFARLAAVDGLMELKRLPEAKRHVLSLADKAERDMDVELAGEVVEFLVQILELEPSEAEQDVLKERVQKLAQALAPKGGP